MVCGGLQWFAVIRRSPSESMNFFKLILFDDSGKLLILSSMGKISLWSSFYYMLGLLILLQG